MGTVARGIAAGAAGVTALNGAGYLDRALRGRPASTLPERTVDALVDLTGLSLPGGAEGRAARRSALGALSGIITGVAVAVTASLTRQAGFRLPPPLAAGGLGVAALAATDGARTRLGVAGPRSWRSTDWTGEVVPHLAYGLAAHAVLDMAAGNEPPPQPAGTALLVRSAALGVASGSRASIGFLLPGLVRGQRTGRTPLAVLGLGSELVMDKLPGTGSRLDPPGPQARMASAVAGTSSLARHSGQNAALPAVAGVAGAALGTWGGAAWRRWAGSHMPDWQAAVAEDAVALTLAIVACLTGPGPTAPLPD